LNSELGWLNWRGKDYMKKGKVKYIITKTPAQINKVIDKVIDKLKDTPEWKSTAKRFTKKAMEVISKL
jgi:hypothetical protein